MLDDIGISHVYVYGEEEKEEVIGNCFVDIKKAHRFSIDGLNIKKKVRYKVLREILDNFSTEEEIKAQLIERKRELVPKHITEEDIIASSVISSIYSIL